jgi:hypothetical protein
MMEKIEITYEVSHTEPIHPDPQVACRFREFAIGNCGYGCKIYKDPLSEVKVLAHNSNYGCRR